MTAKRRFVGSFFHTFGEDERILKQGEVLTYERDSGLVFVQYFSWIDGRPTSREFVPMSIATTWSYYPNADEMNAAWEKSK